MTFVKKKALTSPALYEHIQRKDPNVHDHGWDKVGGFTLRNKVDFAPQRGLQEKFCASDCNLIFIGGAAQSGKTYSMFLKALNGLGASHPGYTARVVSVRLQDSKKGSSIFRDAVEVCGNFADCQYASSDYPTFTWPQWNASLQLIHANFNADNPTEWEDFKDYIKKQQASYIAIDEATEIKQFKMFSYMFSRNRDSSGMRPCMALSFNPEHEHWTTTMLRDAGYIGDDWYLKPEMNGVVKYFHMGGDTPEDIIWGDTPEDVIARADIELSDADRRAGVTERDIVKSFTMISGEAAGNLKLVAATQGGSIANLHAVGKTQKSVLKDGYFGPVEKEISEVSRDMLHNLFTNPQYGEDSMFATMDVSGGGKNSDNCPMVIWKGLSIIAIKMFRGDPKELVDWINKTLQEYGVPIKNFAFDATGIGYYLTSFTSGTPVTPGRAPLKEFDANGNQVMLEQYFNLRSQILGKTRVLFQKGEISCILPKNTMLPYGKNGENRALIDILYDEIHVFRSMTRNRKIYYRSKDEYKAKFHASPDLMDAISMRSIFELDARPKKQETPEIADDAYDSLYSNYGRQGRGGTIWV